MVSDIFGEVYGISDLLEGPSLLCKRYVLIVRVVGSGCSRCGRCRLKISTSQGLASFCLFALDLAIYRVSRSSLLRCFPKSRCPCKEANTWNTLMHPSSGQAKGRVARGYGNVKYLFSLPSVVSTRSPSLEACNYPIFLSQS